LHDHIFRMVGESDTYRAKCHWKWWMNLKAKVSRFVVACTVLQDCMC
jgi:hypothetical protein